MGCPGGRRAHERGGEKSGLAAEVAPGGAERAEHGEAPVKEPSRRLGEDFGKGFDERNFRFTRRFYLAFPIRNALRTELSWTHHRRLMRVADSEVRMWCTNECAESNWRTRELMNEGDDPPAGIVLRADRSDSLVEYTLLEDNAQLFAAKDLSRPPSREELAFELSAEYRALDEAAVG